MLKKVSLTSGDRAGFTLIEMMVAVAVLAVLLGIIAAVTQGTAVAVRQATGKLSTYAAARAAFNTMNEKLAQATLNTYLDYYDSENPAQIRTAGNESSFTPSTYGRVSNLQFLVQQNALDDNCGQEIYFQCPESFSGDSTYQTTPGLLNACGYYVQYCSDASFEPTLVTAKKWRYRLMQAIEPTEDLSIYETVLGNTGGVPAWVINIANTGAEVAPAKYALPLADNIIALVIWPQVPNEAAVDAAAGAIPLAPNYTYDSQYEVGIFSGTPPAQPETADQLPPIVQVTMIVIDEASAVRIDTNSEAEPAVISGALNGKFTDITKYGADLNSVEEALSAAHIGFEVLSTSVVLQGAKFTQ